MTKKHACGIDELRKCSLALRLGRRIHQWREKRDLPLKALAFDLGISVSTIDAWEQGTRFPSAKHLDELSIYMEVPVCGLLYPGEGDCAFFSEDGECPVLDLES